MRRNYLDNVRSLTILLVVLYHVIYMFNGIEGVKVLGPFKPFQIQDSIQYLLYPWFMAVLFIISGMCSRYYLDGHNAKDFRKARTRKLLVPSTLGLFAFQWIQGLVNMKIFSTNATVSSDIPKFISVGIVILSGTGVLWFAQILWIYSMLLLLVRRFENGKLYSVSENCPIWVLFVFVIPFWLFSQILNAPIIATYRFGIYFFCFFVGYFVFAHDQITEKLSQYWLLLSVISLVLGVSYTVLFFGQNYPVKPVVNSPLACSYGWFACLSVFALGKRFLDRTSNFWDFLKKNNWGIYVFHYLGASGCALLLRETTVSPILQYLLCGISSVVISFSLYQLISRIPLFRWCVLGISKN